MTAAIGKGEEESLAQALDDSLRIGQSSQATPATANELAHFRSEWEAEVKRNRGSTSASVTAHQVPSQSEPQPNTPVSAYFRPVSNNTQSRRPLIVDPHFEENRVANDDEEEESLANNGIQPEIRQMRKSVLSYAQAVEAERKGDLDVALKHYRKAFRLDADADRLFDRASNAMQAELDRGAREYAGKHDIIVDSDEIRTALCKALEVEDFRFRAIKEQQERAKKQIENSQPIVQTQESPEKKKKVRSRDKLSVLIERLSLQGGGERDFSQVRFEPEDEEKPVHMANLPEEVLLHILTFIAAPRGKRGARIKSQDNDEQQQAAALADVPPSIPVAAPEEITRRPAGIGVVLAVPDYVSIERLGRTCWKFRILTMTWSVWSLIVHETYYPPQVPPKLALPAIVKGHGNDWRTTFVDQPRIRLNGAYIAACHYTRPGMHEDNVWVQVVHVVELYRSLRFLPDGRTLSLLTTESPSQTVRKMEPSLRVKGFAIGTWSLHPQGLSDDDVYSRPAGPKIIIENLKDKTMSRYMFRLILRLGTTSRGRWNRMEMLEYESINLQSGEICPLPLCKTPFRFEYCAKM